MANNVPQNIKDLVKREENEALYLGKAEAEVYPDADGYSAGFGHYLTDEELKKYPPGSKVPQDQVDAWFEEDIQKSYNAAQKQNKQLPKEVDIGRLTSVNYQLGESWNDISVNEDAFKETWGLMQSGDFTGASMEVLDSKWAKIQTPERAQKFSDALASLGQSQTTSNTAIPPTNTAGTNTAGTNTARPSTAGPSTARPAFYDNIKFDRRFSNIDDLYIPPSDPSLHRDLYEDGLLETTPTGVAEKWMAATGSGYQGLKANINYLDAGLQALMGDEYEMRDQLAEAESAQKAAAAYLHNTTTFEEFLDNPTVGGFLEQTLFATGKFAPSAVASIGAAAVGAIIGAIAAPAAVTIGAGTLATGALLTGAGRKAAIKIMTDAWKKRAKNLKITRDEYDLTEKSYPLLQKLLGARGTRTDAPIFRQMSPRATRVGGLTGAGAQEWAQGAGITFGNYADQGMTGPREAAISFAAGVPYAGIGLAGEVVAGYAVLAPFIRVAKQKAHKAGVASFLGVMAKEASKGFAIGSLGEGGAEFLQEGISITQKFAIDPEYTRAQARLDAMEAAFMGFMGGGILGGAGRGVTGTARELVERATMENNPQMELDLGPVEIRNAGPTDLEKARKYEASLERARKRERVIKGTTATTATAAPEEGLKAHINQIYDTIKENIQNSTEYDNFFKRQRALIDNEEARIEALKAEGLETGWEAKDAREAFALEIEAEIKELTEQLEIAKGDKSSTQEQDNELRYRIAGLKKVIQALRQGTERGDTKVFNQAAVEEYLAAVKAEMQLDEEIAKPSLKEQSDKWTQAEKEAHRKRIKDVVQRVKKAYNNLIIEDKRKRRTDTGAEQGTGEPEFPDFVNPPGQQDLIDSMIEDSGVVPEPQSWIVAQLRAMLDGSNKKDAVWIPEGHPAPTKNQLKEIFGDKQVFSADVEGKGRIISIKKEVVDKVVQEGANEASIAEALKYSEVKNATHDRVAVVTDREGNQVHSESTNQVNFPEVTEKNKEAYPSPEYNVEEQAYDPEDVIDNRLIEIQKENQDGVQVQQALEEIAEAEPGLELSRVLDRYNDNYQVLKAIYTALKDNNSPTAIAAKEDIAAKLKTIIKNYKKKLIENEGFKADEIGMPNIERAIQNDVERALEEEREASSPTARVTEQVQGAVEAQELRQQDPQVLEDVAEIEAEAFEEYNLELTENKKIIIGKNLEGTPYSLAQPQLDNRNSDIVRRQKAREALLGTIEGEEVSILTPEERAKFLVEEKRLASIERGIPTGLMEALYNFLITNPGARFNIRYVFKDEQKEVLRYSPASLLATNKELAASLGIDPKDVGIVVEFSLSPEMPTITINDKTTTINEYFKTIFTTRVFGKSKDTGAAKSKEKYRKRGFLVKRPGDKEPIPYDLVSLIWNTKPIVTAEEDYVAGDLRQSVRAFQALLSIGDELGYKFYINNNTEKTINEYTTEELYESKTPLYIKGDKFYTLGAFLKTNAVRGNKTTFNDLYTHTKDVVREILSPQNEEATSIQRYETVEDIVEKLQEKLPNIRIESDPITFNYKGETVKHAGGIAPIVIPRDFEAKVVAQEVFGEEFGGLEAGEVQQLGQDQLFAFNAIIDELYNIAKEERVDLYFLESNFFGTEETAIDRPFEPGTQAETDYGSPEKKNYSDTLSRISAPTYYWQDKPGDVSYSKDFNKHLGRLLPSLIKTIKQNKFFDMDSNVVFITHNDVVDTAEVIETTRMGERSKRRTGGFKKTEKINRVLKAYLKEKRAVEQEDSGREHRGVHLRPANSNEHIVVIDTAGLVQAEKEYKALPKGEQRLNINKDKLATAEWVILTTLAHEIGHVVELDVLDNLHRPEKKGIRNKLLAEFEKVKNSGVTQYKDPKTGFREWVADQTAIWLINYARDGRKLRPSKNIADSFFRNLAKRIVKIWDSLVKDAKTIRVNIKEPNIVFTQWVNDLSTRMKETAQRDISAGKLSFEQQDQVNSMISESIKGFNFNKSTYKALYNKVAQTAKGVVNNSDPIVDKIKKVFYSTTGWLEQQGPVGIEISEMLSKKSVTEGEQGYVDASHQMSAIMFNEVTDILNLDSLSFFQQKFNQEQEEAFYYAEDDGISDIELIEISPMAYDLRDFLRERFYPYMKEKGLDVGFLETNRLTPDGEKLVSYFPRTLAVFEIFSNDMTRARFRWAIVKKVENRSLLVQVKQEDGSVVSKIAEPRKGQTVEQWADEYITKILHLTTTDSSAENISVDSLIATGQVTMKDINRLLDNAVDPNSVSLGMPSILSRTLRLQTLPDIDGTPDENGVIPLKEYGFSTNELRQLGLLEEPITGFMNYIRQGVKRTELEARGGEQWLEQKIAELPVEKQAMARDAIRATLGKTTGPMSNLMRNINSWGLVANILTTLTFAVFASFPDLAGPFLRSREFKSFTEGGKELSHYFTPDGKEEAIRFAMDVGAVSQDALAAMYINAAEMDYMTPNAKKITDAFFKTIMLDQFTRFTRVFAAGMGKRFLVGLAHNNEMDPERRERYFRELNITKEEVLAVEKSGFDLTTPEGKRFSQAVYTFVNESIIRPNAAQRPAWASNPYFALVWQLKGFFYAYGKTIIGGQYREIMNRYNEAGAGAAAFPLMMMAVTIMPLTMLGLEFREFLKYSLGVVLPGVEGDQKYFRSDDMDAGTYTMEMIDRSGILGAWGLLFPFLPGQSFGGPYETGAGLVGPTADKVYDLFDHGPFSSRFWKEQVPVYYTLW